MFDDISLRRRLLTASSLLVVFLQVIETAQATIRIPLFSGSIKKGYTPLVFFKVPAGLIPECDAMERTVRQVEKELGVRVERLDVLRDPAAEAAMALLTQGTPPFLYHRESCQVVTAAMPLEGAAGKARVRAWAKGRLLQARRVAPSNAKKTKTPVVLSQEDTTAISQEELLEDMTLTPQQREGKHKMNERTEALRKK